MPPRHLILVIFAFWVATIGWLFYRDLWPSFLPDEPPPFTIDLADEVSEQKIFWRLFQNGVDKGGYAFSWVHYRPAEDLFDVSSEFKLFSRGKPLGQTDPDQIVESIYSVTREGELRQVRAEVTIKLPTNSIQAKITGRVDHQQFHPHLRITGSSIEVDRELQPVAVSHRGNVLNPLQPLNRIQGLRPGQHWRIPVIDPLQDALSAFTGRPSEVGFLEADVLPQAEVLTWGSPHRQRQDECLVIVYQSESCQGRTWVRVRDGVVLRQEFTQHGETLALERD